MKQCMSSALVRRYKDGHCTEKECRDVEIHIAECEKCRNKVEDSVPDSSIIQQSEATLTFAPFSTQDTSKTAAIRSDQNKSITRPIDVTAVSKPDTDIVQKAGDSSFPNYKIIEELPRGGQAVVYKAFHIPTKTLAAIKVLLPSLLPSARARYYFEREAELIATLDHPNIVKIRDSGIIHGQYYFVMEYIQGAPLTNYANSHNLSFKERIILFKKVCAAVTYAHQKGIIHRDLKSGNILVDERSEPHILDFGLAKAIGLSETDDKNAMHTMTGQWAGSLLTMSPEQAAGQPDLIDVRTDIYSLGSILYHMLTGTYPYNMKGSTLEILQNIQKTDPIRPRQIERKFDADVEAILLTSLAKDKDQRYQSVADLQSDLDNWLQGLPIRVRSISTMYLLKKIIARHRYTTTVVALLLAILLSFASVYYHMYGRLKNTNRRLQASIIARNQELASQTSFMQEVGMDRFLDAFQAHRTNQARFAAKFFSEETPQSIAAAFLLDTKPLAQKIETFRKKMLPIDACFTDFIIAEQYFYDKDFVQAENLYRRCLANDQIEEKRWIMMRALKRLEELQKQNTQIRNAPENQKQATIQ
ncbi:MAG: protein kinase [Planctomycetota bacterium]